MIDRASARTDDLAAVPCPLCDGTDLALYVYAPSHYGPEKLRIARCRSCRMIFTNPQSSSYENRVKDRGVLERYFNRQRLKHAQQNASLRLSHIRDVSPGKRILDFGCGEGAFVVQAKKEGWDAVGVDLNDGLIQAARKYWPCESLHAMSIDALFAKQWQFDVVYSNQVFEHLRRPVEIGQALVRLLAPRGIIYVNVPNANQMKEFLRPGATLDPTSHFNHFTSRTLAHLLERIGCRVLYCSGSPGMFKVWRRLGLGPAADPAARFARRLLPGVGTGVCGIGRKQT